MACVQVWYNCDCGEPGANVAGRERRDREGGKLVGFEDVVETLGVAKDRITNGDGPIKTRLAKAAQDVRVVCGSELGMPCALATGFELLRPRLTPDKLKRMSEREISLTARQIVFLADIAADSALGSHCRVAIAGAAPAQQSVKELSSGETRPKIINVMRKAGESEQNRADREITRILNDNQHPYWNGKHPEHDQAVIRMQELQRVAKRWEKQRN